MHVEKTSEAGNLGGFRPDPPGDCVFQKNVVYLYGRYWIDEVICRFYCGRCAGKQFYTRYLPSDSKTEKVKSDQKTEKKVKCDKKIPTLWNTKKEVLQE